MHHKDEVLLAKMDAKPIVQVIINLVGNAIKSPPEGSSITVCMELKDGKAVISIADDGGGIPDDMKPKIFDMFYSGAKKSAAQPYQKTVPHFLLFPAETTGNFSCTVLFITRRFFRTVGAAPFVHTFFGHYIIDCQCNNNTYAGIKDTI